MRRLLLAFVLLVVCAAVLALFVTFSTPQPSSAPAAGTPAAAGGAGSVSPRPVPAAPAGDAARAVRGASRRDAVPPPATHGDAIADEYLLSFYSEEDREAFLAVARRLGVEVLDTMRLGFSVRIRAERDALTRLRGEAPVAIEFEPNYTVRTPPLPVVDPRRPQGDYVFFGDAALPWLGVANNSGWGEGIKVAVLDSGVQAHPALEHAVAATLDLADGTPGDAAAGSAHGTAVASLIAGNVGPVRGMAPEAELLNVRVIAGDGRSDAFTAAKGIVEAVDAGAAVINCSFGTRSDSFVLRSAVRYAAAQGAVVVASTGNEGSLGVSFPAAYPEAVAVAAVDGRGEHLYFSNRGEAVDVAAPGLGVAAAWTDEGVVPFSGTSAATPLVSGAIAALMSQEPGLSAADAVDLLKEYSIDAAAPGPDVELGRGILNMRRVLQRNETGIYDVMAGRPYVASAEDSDDMRVWVYAQNTGTEPLRDVRLSADINGAAHSLRFSNVRVGQTVSHEFRLTREELELAGLLEIKTAAELDGVEDIYPRDNRQSVTVVPTK